MQICYKLLTILLFFLFLLFFERVQTRGTIENVDCTNAYEASVNSYLSTVVPV